MPTPSPYLQKTIEFYWSIKDDVSNVTPALRGESQRGETLGAVRQQLEQSYGGLTSTLQSFAECKNTVFLQKARMAKECWSVEDFQRVASMFGEIWTDEDVAEMKEVDFERDLIVSYAEGSEMPQSNIDKELKFAQGINTLLPFIQAGVPIPPDKFGKILEKIDELAGFDFDLTGLEVNDLLAQKRYLELNGICQKYGPVSSDEIDVMKQTVASIDPMDGTPVTELDLLTEQIFHQANIKFSPYENLQAQLAYFAEQVQVEMGKATTNYLFLEMLQTICGFIQQAMQQLMAEQPNPEAEAAAAEAEAQNAKDKEAADREDTHRNADREASHAQANADRAADLVKTLAGHDSAEKQAAIKGAAALQAAKAKPKAAPAAAK